MEGTRVEVHSDVDARAEADFYRGGTEVLMCWSFGWVGGV